MNTPAQLTTKQVAQRLSTTPHTVRVLLQTGRLPGIKLSAFNQGKWRIDPGDLEAFIKAEKAKNKRAGR